MGRRRKNGPKEKARKRVNVKLLDREHAGKVTGPYKLLDLLVAEHHSHLVDAKIAIAWRFGWRADADGRVILVSVKKGSDLDREMHGYDFVFLINHEVWNGGGFSERAQLRLIDHACCRCQVSKDSNGEEKIDENGRTTYRMRKPDIVEFCEVVARHGLCTDDLTAFAQAAGLADQNRPLLKDQEPEAVKPKAKADANGQHQGKADPGDWRSVSIEALNIFGATAGALISADLGTLGKIRDYCNAHDGRLDSVPGIGPAKAATIAERLEMYWRTHPHDAEAAQAEVGQEAS